MHKIQNALYFIIYHFIKNSRDRIKITDLKNNVYTSEVMFWMEIDQIYSYFDHKAKELGLDNPEEKLFTLSNNPLSL